MCTLILGVEVLGPRTVLLAANRDEDPVRPSDPPLVLSDHPLVTGGRDRRAGGTWLALRGRHAAVAMLNRRSRGAFAVGRMSTGGRPLDDPEVEGGQPLRGIGIGGHPSPSALRSRGLLALDCARVELEGDTSGGSEEDAIPRAILARAELLVRGVLYAPFSLVVASPGGCWLLAHDGVARPRTTQIGSGWHTLTHEELDDPREPRAAWLVRELAGFSPASRSEAEARLGGLLALHAGEAGRGSPAVCLHEGPVRTVSAARVWLAPGEGAYHHAEGRPCTATWKDVTALLDDPPRAG